MIICKVKFNNFKYSKRIIKSINEIHKESFKLDDMLVWEEFLTYAFIFIIVQRIQVISQNLKKKYIMNLYLQLSCLEGN